MKLGSGFAYMGKEYLLSVAGKEQFSDIMSAWQKRCSGKKFLSLFAQKLILPEEV